MPRRLCQQPVLRARQRLCEARFDERALALCGALLAVLLLHAVVSCVRRWRRDARNAAAGSGTHVTFGAREMAQPAMMSSA